MERPLFRIKFGQLKTDDMFNLLGGVRMKIKSWMLMLNSLRINTPLLWFI